MSCAGSVFLNNPFVAHILRAYLEGNAERFAQTRTLIGYHHDYHRRAILDARFEVMFRDKGIGLSLYRASSNFNEPARE